MIHVGSPYSFSDCPTPLYIWEALSGLSKVKKKDMKLQGRCRGGLGGVGRGSEDGYNKNILYTCMRFSSNKLKVCFLSSSLG